MSHSLRAALLFAVTLGGTAFAATTPDLKQNPKLAEALARLQTTMNQAKSGQASQTPHSPKLPKGHTPKDVVLARLARLQPAGAAADVSGAKPNASVTYQLPSLVAARQFNVPVPSDGLVYASAEGDFNNDGVADIVTLSVDGAVDVFLNDGSGDMKQTYAFALPLAPPNHSYIHPQVLAADLNGDGYADVTVMDSSNNTFIVFLSNGDGTLRAPVTYNVAPNNGANFFLGGGGLAIADMTGDGHPDMVVVSGGNSDDFTQTYIALQVFPGNGDGTFGTPIESDSTLNDLYAMTPGNCLQLVDTNGDGKLDAAIFINDLGVFGTQAGDGVMIASGAGSSFAAFNSFAAFAPGADNLFYAMTSFAVTDLNGDGAADILFNDGSGNIYKSTNQGGGSYGTASVVFASDAYQQIAVGDLNGDKVPDIVVYQNDALITYLGSSDGSYTKQNTYVGGFFSGFQQPALANYGGANAPLGAAYIDTVQLNGLVMPGNGDGTFSAAYSALPSAISVADVNGDGLEDYIGLDYSNSSQNSGLPDIVSYLSNGKGGYTKVVGISGSYFASAGATQVSVQSFVKDLNNDGHPDLVLSTGTDIEFAAGNGDGTFQNPVVLSLGSYSQLGCEPGVGSAASGADGAVVFVIPYGGPDSCSIIPIILGSNAHKAQDSGTTPPSGVFAFTNGGANVNFTQIGASVTQASLTDINNDGILDLITADQDEPSQTYTAYATQGAADGVFNTYYTTYVANGYAITSIMPVDFNADGKMDLAFTTKGIQSGSGTVPGSAGVYLAAGSGDGGFPTTTLADAGVVSLGGVWLDLNGDGLPDLVVSDFAGDFDVPNLNFFLNVYQTAALINGGNGTLPVKTSYSSYNNGPVFAADMNGDGSTDVVTLQAIGPVVFYNRGTTSLTLAASSTTPSQGDTVTFTATVLQGRNVAAASGYVVFSANGSVLGSASLVNGVATFSTAALPVGSDTVTATYAGDADTNAASASIGVKVGAVAAAFSMSATPANLTLAQGATGVVTINLAANAAFNGPITFTCSGAPSNATCKVNPGSLTLAPNQAGSVSVVVATSVKDGPVPTNSSSHKGVGVVAAAGLFALLLPFRRRMPRVLMVLVALLSLGSLAAVTGCGGGNGNPGTPTGSSTLVITATSGNVTQTQSIALTVTK